MAPTVWQHLLPYYLQHVDTFQHLGALTTDDAECTFHNDIHARHGNGTGTLKSTQRLLQSHDISIDTKVRLLKTIVWTAATYKCKGWTLKKCDESWIEVFEMKGLKQILCLMDSKKNQWIDSGKAGVKRSLLASVKTKKLRYFGHIIRHSCLEKDIIQGTLSGKRQRGRPKTTWLGNIIQWTDVDLERV